MSPHSQRGLHVQVAPSLTKTSQCHAACSVCLVNRLGSKPVPNPNNLPIFSSVPSVGFAVRDPISATSRLARVRILANSFWVMPSPLGISATAPRNLRSPVRARSASVHRLLKEFAFRRFPCNAGNADAHGNNVLTLTARRSKWFPCTPCFLRSSVQVIHRTGLLR